MPTIRDLVAAIRRRDDVDAAVVLGRDGRLIDHQAKTDAGAGIESEAQGRVVRGAISTDAICLVRLRPAAGLGALLFDPRRHRARIAALV